MRKQPEKEPPIGGEFGISPKFLGNDEPLPSFLRSQYKNEIKRYAFGRTALYAILKNISGEFSSKILLPDYLCSSIVSTVQDAKWSFDFYTIGRDFRAEETFFDFQLHKDFSAVLLINYFGCTDLEKSIRMIRAIAPKTVVIIDDVQNYFGFGKEKDFDYAFTSSRKWFPVVDGAFAISKRKKWQTFSFENKENKSYKFKLSGNLLKNSSDIDDKVFLRLLKKGEAEIDGGYLCACWGGMWPKMSLDMVRKIRESNALFLHLHLSKMGINHLYQRGATPLFVPIILDKTKRDDLRADFFRHQIFTPVHWPQNSPEMKYKNNLYEEELSLICDQRYGEREMLRIIDVLQEWQNANKNL